jgi:hypothetical protein
VSVEALQDCLAAEHAAVYGYGVLGGVLAGESAPGSADQERAASGYVEHRTRRDDLTAEISATGADPVAADPAYELPGPVVSVDDCRSLARDLEERCAQVYADAVSRSADDDRATAARALTACALRAVSWGARPEPFPGVAEL